MPVDVLAHINSLAPGRFKKCNLQSCFTSHDNVLRWMPQDLTDDQSTLVQVMAWCCQATSHFLNQCWPRSPPPYGVTRPQWVNANFAVCLNVTRHCQATCSSHSANCYLPFSCFANVDIVEVTDKLLVLWLTQRLRCKSWHKSGLIGDCAWSLDLCFMAYGEKTPDLLL